MKILTYAYGWETAKILCSRSTLNDDYTKIQVCNVCNHFVLCMLERLSFKGP